ncbi:DUF4123 domain-containing protein [Pseudomonas sp. NCHU5208]|uniref:DUF4123 domain-containing protein n=1 Tax=unclassified Pseudomonas TaxID=196821 RepID=UPI003F9DDCC1
MLEGLSEFQALARHTAVELLQEHVGELLFIIDTQRQPDAMIQLYQLGEELDLRHLYAETELAEWAQEGPIWFSAPRDSKRASLGMRLCHERQAGMVICTSDEQAALAHARWLLRVRDGSGGESLVAYHLPAIWNALALTATERALLFGPWEKVFSPAPYSSQSSEQWLGWIPPEALDGSWNHHASLELAEAASAYMRTLRWVYWIDEERAGFGIPTAEQLPRLIANLETLVEHRIYEGRHLLELTQLVKGEPISERPEVMDILQRNEEAFLKVKSLQALTATTSPT